MSAFHGVCSFPHGGRASGFLLLSLASAVVCTCYSIASCRFASVEFASNLGNFDEYFIGRTNGNGIGGIEEEEEEIYKVGIGLFTWLQPAFYNDGDDDAFTRANVGEWQTGTCVGYTTLQRETILDSTFDGVRIVGVLSVLAGMSIFLFSLFVSCLALNNFQRYALAASSLSVAVLNGCAFMILQSGVCAKVGTDSECNMDQGGLVGIAAVILWVCSCLQSIFFMEPVQQPGLREKVSQDRQQKQKSKQLQQMRKQNQWDWNGKNRKSSKSKGKHKIKQVSRSIPKTPNTVASSPSSPTNNSHTTTPSPRNIIDDLHRAESQRRPSSPVARQPFVKVKKTAMANNKSLEMRYVPNPVDLDDDIESARSSNTRSLPPAPSQQPQHRMKPSKARGKTVPRHQPEQEEEVSENFTGSSVRGGGIGAFMGFNRPKDSGRRESIQQALAKDLKMSSSKGNKKSKNNRNSTPCSV